MNEEDVIELQPTTEAFSEDKIGMMTSEPATRSEVGGRAIVLRLARCGNCGNVGYINYDTVNYRAYQCNRCGSCACGPGGHSS